MKEGRKGMGERGEGGVREGREGAGGGGRGREGRGRLYFILWKAIISILYLWVVDCHSSRRSVEDSLVV